MRWRTVIGKLLRRGNDETPPPVVDRSWNGADAEHYPVGRVEYGDRPLPYDRVWRVWQAITRVVK